MYQDISLLDMYEIQDVACSYIYVGYLGLIVQPNILLGDTAIEQNPLMWD